MAVPDLSTHEGREQVRKIPDAASPWPWEVPDRPWATIASGADVVIMLRHPRNECHECGEPYDMEPEVVLSVEDKALICVARTAVPALLEDALDTVEVRADRAEAALQRVRDVLDNAHEDFENVNNADVRCALAG